MPLPHVLAAGDVAHAQDMNDNFDYVVGLVGNLSDGTNFRPPGPIIMGPRGNTQFISSQDTTGAVDPLDQNNAFLQIGWNAEYYDTGLVDGLSRPIYKFRRYNAGERASAIRVGEDGFTVLTTGKTQGDLDSQMEKAFEVRPDDANGNRVYLPTSWGFTNYDGPPQDESDYRLMMTPMSPVATIYQDKTLQSGRTMHKASDYGVPPQAKALVISASVTTTPTDDEHGLMIYQAKNNPNNLHGFAVFTGETGGDRVKTFTGQGIVILGIGSYAGKFYIERKKAFSSVSAYIIAYYA